MLHQSEIQQIASISVTVLRLTHSWVSDYLSIYSGTLLGPEELAYWTICGVMIINTVWLLLLFDHYIMVQKMPGDKKRMQLDVWGEFRWILTKIRTILYIKVNPVLKPNLTSPFKVLYWCNTLPFKVSLFYFSCWEICSYLHWDLGLSFKSILYLLPYKQTWFDLFWTLPARVILYSASVCSRCARTTERGTADACTRQNPTGDTLRRRRHENVQGDNPRVPLYPH